MRRLRYLDASKRDLAKILEYVTRESGSIEIGLKAVRRIRERARRIADLPGILGRSRIEFGEDLRSVVAGSYVIFFRYRRNAIEITNVIEGHRDLPSALEETVPS